VKGARSQNEACSKQVWNPSETSVGFHETTRHYIPEDIQGDSGGVTASYGAHFWRPKVSYKPGSYTQYLQSYVRIWIFFFLNFNFNVNYELHNLNVFIVTNTN
jgi:hypothetical protein